jgi:hypothetical protein
MREAKMMPVIYLSLPQSLTPETLSHAVDILLRKGAFRPGHPV